MNAYLCGRWDGCHLWCQWDDLAPSQGYRLELRLRLPGAADWLPWRAIGGPAALEKPWLVVPLWKGDAEVEARVAIEAPELEWFPLAEVTFDRSTCRFELQAGARPAHYQAGTEFAAIVDHAGCHYRLVEEVEVQAGESALVTMEAALLTGWCQLDHPDHFSIRPALGRVIRNVAASVTLAGSQWPRVRAMNLAIGVQVRRGSGSNAGWKDEVVGSIKLLHPN